MSEVFTGKITDVDFRRRRAQRAAKARTALDYYVRKVVEQAPELTTEQRDRLSQLLGGAA